MSQAAWIVTLFATSAIAISGWTIAVIRDVKKTAADLQKIVAGDSTRIAVLENQYKTIHEDLVDIKKMIKHMEEKRS